MRDIEVTGVSFENLVRSVYALSGGVVPLTDVDVRCCIRRYMYYVVRVTVLHGVACTFYAYQDNNRVYVPATWDGHTPEQLTELLRRIQC